MADYHCNTCGETCTLNHEDKAEFLPPLCPWDGERCTWSQVSEVLP
jgi:hypothetical protein